MRVAFVVHRTTYYKIFGPVIDAALRRGIEVECWLLHDGTGKAYLTPRETNVPNSFSARVGLRSFDSEVDLGTALDEDSLDAVFSLHPKSTYQKQSLKSGAIFVILQSGIDTFLMANVEDVASSDLVCLYSPFWAEWGARYYERTSQASYERAMTILMSKSIFPGFPELDVFHSINPVEVRSKLRLAPEKPVVLLLPITLGNKDGIWPRFFEKPTRLNQIKFLLRGKTDRDRAFARAYWSWALNGWNDRSFTAAVAKFAERNNALLIAKGRQKDMFRPWMTEVADRAIYDEAMYPSTILELLAISDVCIHFYSFAVLESAFTKTFGITVDRPSPAVDFDARVPVYHELWRHAREDGAFNSPGVNKWMSIPEAIQSLPAIQIGDLQMEEAARKRYIQQFLGLDDGKASDRVLDSLNRGQR